MSEESVELKVVIAIVRRDVIERVESKLQEAGVRGVTVSKAKGYGEHPNFFARDWMVDTIRIEIFTTADGAETIARTIIDAAHSGAPGDGIVAVLPVEKAFSIRSRSETIPNRPRPGLRA